MRSAAALLAILAVGPVALALAGQREGRGTPDLARLVVGERFIDTGAVYIEGARSYLVIRRRGAARPVVRREYDGRMWLNKDLPAGRYRLVSYVRACVGFCPEREPQPCGESSCPEPGGLDPPSDRCAKDFRLRSGRASRAVVLAGVGTRCRVNVSAHRIAVRGLTRPDVALARDLRRNAGNARWYPAVRVIEARRGVLTVHSTLRRTRRARTSAREICNLIQGADVADFTPGHTVRGRKQERIANCAARTRADTVGLDLG